MYEPSLEVADCLPDGRIRIRAELIDRGERASSNRVARLMRFAGLRGISRRRGFASSDMHGKFLKTIPVLLRNAPRRFRMMAWMIHPSTSDLRNTRWHALQELAGMFREVLQNAIANLFSAGFQEYPQQEEFFVPEGFV